MNNPDPSVPAETPEADKKTRTRNQLSRQQSYALSRWLDSNRQQFVDLVSMTATWPLRLRLRWVSR